MKPQSNNKKARKPLIKRRGIKILMGILIVLIALRIALPYIVLKYANKTLSTMHGYYGHVNDVDIALYRGAYKIKNVYLNKVDTLTMEETEFFQARMIDLSVEWEALIDGKIVGELEFHDPRLKFTKEKTKAEELEKDTTDFRKLLNDFMPLQVNRFEIINGVIQYQDPTSTPKVDIQLDNAHILAENLKTEKSEKLLPAKVTADANIYKGHLSLELNLDPFAKAPTFDMNAELKDTHLPELNDFFKAYGKFDVNRGTFGLFTEVASKEGNFVGYVKPVIKDLDILGMEDREDNILQKAWEAIVGGAGQLLRNQKHDQVATKVPLEGNFKDTEVNILYAIVEILKNAFIQALQPTIDQQINIGTTSTQDLESQISGKDKNGNINLKNNDSTENKKENKGILKKIFNKNDKDKQKSEEKK
ncbi:MAG: hypothetical protein K0S44_1212 [Bacteroidetes bacterium]|jgi:hypothetical protein|nr:hypothetical protein [Bacteroidota bacterium]